MHKVTAFYGGKILW